MVKPKFSIYLVCKWKECTINPVIIKILVDQIIVDTNRSAKDNSREIANESSLNLLKTPIQEVLADSIVII